ncbi:MAG: 30S ribosomal protein S18 [Actinomycetota bacterium]|jgi:ribosomal protein S18|nr:30S ribosomal protein S18 [Euzebyales bacterium]MDQ3030584.1 30S ribosomal protein S18 [Actinomycetota bacterium]MDQ3326562.1 30S ribosomal protein S18 [Actinomycetota bacterium]MDQ3529710.1 30S ribosomal protein S18 [Actinomycetota bacterium]MDQ3538399.1 30S ribosomal protein S18 [Actinomycetota bacterium]
MAQRRNEKPAKRKECYFSKNKIEYVDYKDVALLRKFVSDRGKIRSLRVTGTTPQYQKLVAQAVKNAREMALLPYTTR